MEAAFVFFNKNDNEKICHIGFTEVRNKDNEITYGTEEPYRKQGFMSEALAGFVAWIFQNTDLPCLWGLPSSNESERILIRCGFSPIETAEATWYRRER